MGTALRYLSPQGKNKGGYGKLTQAAITKCTGYFSKAIRAHPNDLEAIKNAVFATFHHIYNTFHKLSLDVSYL